MITEVILTTSDKDQTPHLAPVGLLRREEYWVIAPFRPSSTLNNLYLNSCCIANLTTDSRVFAGCVTGRRVWPLIPTQAGFPPRLAVALAHWGLVVRGIEEDPIRPRFVCEIISHGEHGSFAGYNRAFGAVVEASILVSRIDFLPDDLIAAEFCRLRQIILKTAGPLEAEGFTWLEEKLLSKKRPL